MTAEENGVPAFLADKLTTQYGVESAAGIVQGYADAVERPVTLRANTLKATAEEIAAALTEAGIPFSRVPWYTDAFMLAGVRERAVWDLDIYRDGKVYLQSLSSMLPPLLLGAQPGADVLDMCAAPGGKTSQIAALSGGAAHLTACELNGPRADKLAYNLDKLGAANVQIMRTDARQLDEFFRFDAILLDAPCTGSGTVRAGDERAESRITDKLLAKVTRSQRALLDRALTVLKPGGTLVYSTCSVLAEENEAQVEAALALKRHRNCVVAPIVLGELPAETKTADDKKDDRPKPVVLPHADTGALAIPTLPCTLPGALTVAPTRDFEGFFACVIRKRK